MRGAVCFSRRTDPRRLGPTSRGALRGDCGVLAAGMAKRRRSMEAQLAGPRQEATHGRFKEKVVRLPVVRFLVLRDIPLEDCLRLAVWWLQCSPKWQT